MKKPAIANANTSKALNQIVGILAKLERIARNLHMRGDLLEFGQRHLDQRVTRFERQIVAEIAKREKREKAVTAARQLQLKASVGKLARAIANEEVTPTLVELAALAQICETENLPMEAARVRRWMLPGYQKRERHKRQKRGRN